MSDADVPAMPFSEFCLPPVAFGLGTICQDEPLYRSTSVDETLPTLYACPTAQTLDGENEVTAPSPSLAVLFGLATIRQEAADAGAAPAMTGMAAAAARTSSRPEADFNTCMIRSFECWSSTRELYVAAAPPSIAPLAED